MQVLEKKFTKGPWRYEQDCEGTYNGFVLKGANGRWIGNVHATADDPAKLPQAEADVRLAAHAPQLVFAVEHLLGVVAELCKYAPADCPVTVQSINPAVLVYASALGALQA